MLPELLTPIPGPKSRALAEKLRRYESRNVTFVADDWPIFWEAARGVNVWDADGNRFLDMTSAFGVASLGHGATAAAAAAQLAVLPHAMGDVHPTALKAELCEKLAAITFGRWTGGAAKVVLGSSGGESIEAALKTALIHTGRRGVIAFHGGYHGLGYGALAAGGIPYFREPFRAQLGDFATLLPLTAGRGEIRTALTGAGAVLIEPVQGRGGCIVPPAELLPLLREECDRAGAVLIFDEILTGFHRTGRFFACEHTGTVPDIVCLGKALTGGLPLSACVGRAEVMDSWPESRGEALHTSTFLGNPAACAMALESTRQHSLPAVAAEVATASAALRAALEAASGQPVRGLGLMLGVPLYKTDGHPDGDRAIRLVKHALRAGIILLADSPAANVLSFTPPFCVDGDAIAYTGRWLAEALSGA